MRMDRTCNFPRCRIQQLRKRRFGNQVGGLRSDDVDAEQISALPISDHFYKTIRFSVHLRFTDR